MVKGRLPKGEDGDGKWGGAASFPDTAQRDTPSRPSCPGRGAAFFMPLRRAGTAQRAVFATVPALRCTAKRRCTASGTQAAAHSASYAGLTRVSIDLHKSTFRSGMDCRIESGNDEEEAKASHPGDDPGLDGRLLYLSLSSNRLRDSRASSRAFSKLSRTSFSWGYFCSLKYVAGFIPTLTIIQSIGTGNVLLLLESGGIGRALASRFCFLSNSSKASDASLRFSLKLKSTSGRSGGSGRLIPATHSIVMPSGISASPKTVSSIETSQPETSLSINARYPANFLASKSGTTNIPTLVPAKGLRALPAGLCSKVRGATACCSSRF